MIDAGQVVAVIGIAPVKPAEFVVFKLSQSAGRHRHRDDGSLRCPRCRRQPRPPQPGTWVDPYRAYNFNLLIQGVDRGPLHRGERARRAIERIRYREAGLNSTVTPSPGGCRTAVTLRYGLTSSSELWTGLDDRRGPGRGAMSRSSCSTGRANGGHALEPDQRLAEGVAGGAAGRHQQRARHRDVDASPTRASPGTRSGAAAPAPRAWGGGSAAAAVLGLARDRAGRTGLAGAETAAAARRLAAVVRARAPELLAWPRHRRPAGPPREPGGGPRTSSSLAAVPDPLAGDGRLRRGPSTARLESGTAPPWLRRAAARPATAAAVGTSWRRQPPGGRRRVGRPRHGPLGPACAVAASPAPARSQAPRLAGRSTCPLLPGPTGPAGRGPPRVGRAGTGPGAGPAPWPRPRPVGRVHGVARPVVSGAGARPRVHGARAAAAGRRAGRPVTPPPAISPPDVAFDGPPARLARPLSSTSPSLARAGRRRPSRPTDRSTVRVARAGTPSSSARPGPGRL